MMNLLNQNLEFVFQNLLRFENIEIDSIKIRELIENGEIQEINFDAENTLIIRNVINALDYLKELELSKVVIDDALYIKINSLLAFEQALEVGHYRDRNCYIDCIVEPIVPPDLEVVAGLIK